jgi:hypothetical protein
MSHVNRTRGPGVFQVWGEEVMKSWIIGSGKDVRGGTE